MRKTNVKRMLGTALLLGTMAVATACGSGEEANTTDTLQATQETEASATVEVDIEAAATTLSQNVTFADTMTRVQDAVAGVTILKSSEDTKVVLYQGNGELADEILIMEAVDETVAAAELAVAQQHVTDKKDSFQDYHPEQAQKAGKAIVVQKGKYVIVCITDDVDNAKTQIDNLFAE